MRILAYLLCVVCLVIFLPTLGNTGCINRFDCPLGYQCVKERYQMEGVCVGGGGPGHYTSPSVLGEGFSEGVRQAREGERHRQEMLLMEEQRRLLEEQRLQLEEQRKYLDEQRKSQEEQRRTLENKGHKQTKNYNKKEISAERKKLWNDCYKRCENYSMTNRYPPLDECVRLNCDD